MGIKAGIGIKPFQEIIKYLQICRKFISIKNFNFILKHLTLKLAFFPEVILLSFVKSYNFVKITSVLLTSCCCLVFFVLA